MLDESDRVAGALRIVDGIRGFFGLMLIAGIGVFALISGGTAGLAVGLVLVAVVAVLLVALVRSGP